MHANVKSRLVGLRAQSVKYRYRRYLDLRIRFVMTKFMGFGGLAAEPESVEREAHFV